MKRLKGQSRVDSGFWEQVDPIFKTFKAEGLEEKPVRCDLLK